MFYSASNKMAQLEANAKATNSVPQLPPVNTPRFSGGKLATIRRKIDEKQILLDVGIPAQYFKAPVTPTTQESSNVPKDSPSTKTIKNEYGDGATIAEKDGKAFMLCVSCGQKFPPERFKLHRQICGESTLKLDKVPFIVKLGIHHVDGEIDKQEAAALTEVKVENEDGTEPEIEVQILQKENLKFEELVIHPRSQLPGGGNNWTEEDDRYMQHLEEAKQRMELFASGKFPALPPPPGPEDLEREFVQCPTCLRRFEPEYAPNHLQRCSSQRVPNPMNLNPNTNKQTWVH